MKRIAIGVLLSCALAGCATQQPPMTRDDYLKATQRVYADKTPEEVFAAAEKLFRLADGDDFTLTWSDDSLFASRRWSIYLVLAATFGTDSWIVKATPQPAGTRVNVAVSSTAAPVTPIPTTGGNMTAGTLPAMSNSIASTAIYDVFWARMDYLLGKRPDWMTCEQANKRVETKVTWGDNSALCNSFNMADTRPDQQAANK